MKFDPTISLGNVLTALGAVITIMWWLHQSGVQSTLLTRAVERLEKAVDGLDRIVNEIDKRLSILEDREDR